MREKKLEQTLGSLFLLLLLLDFYRSTTRGGQNPTVRDGWSKVLYCGRLHHDRPLVAPTNGPLSGLPGVHYVANINIVLNLDTPMYVCLHRPPEP